MDTTAAMPSSRPANKSAAQWPGKPHTPHRRHQNSNWTTGIIDMYHHNATLHTPGGRPTTVSFGTATTSAIVNDKHNMNRGRSIIDVAHNRADVFVPPVHTTTARLTVDNISTTARQISATTVDLVDGPTSHIVRPTISAITRQSVTDGHQLPPPGSRTTNIVRTAVYILTGSVRQPTLTIYWRS